MNPKLNSKFDAGLYRVPNIPLVNSGDDIGQIIYQCADKDGFTIEDHDIIVIASKIVSKAEGATKDLSKITPCEKAKELSEKTGKDARLCQVYIDESTEILDVRGRAIVTKDRLGFINTSSNVDRKNIAPFEKGIVVLLPTDPDESAKRIRMCIETLSKRTVSVIICDSFGKPDRYGAIGLSIGIAGIHHIEEKKGQDLFGNPSNSWIALIDELSAAASMLMGQSNEGYPAVIVRGIEYTPDENANIKNILEN